MEVGFVDEDVGISWTSCGLISLDGLVGNSSIRQDFIDSERKLKFWSNHSYPHAHSHTHTRFMPSFNYSSFNLGIQVLILVFLVKVPNFNRSEARKHFFSDWSKFGNLPQTYSTL